MAVGAVSGGKSPYVQGTDQGGDAVAQLRRQKETLQKQLEAVKSKPKNSQAAQDAAVKQIRQLERQIAQIDQKMQKLSQNQQQGQNASETSAVSSKVLSQSNSPLAGAQEKPGVSDNMQQDVTQDKGLAGSANATGKSLDAYA